MIVARLVVVVFLAATAAPVPAMQTVTLRVPVNLQNLHPEVTKFSIACTITPTDAIARTDVPVVNRAFSGTVEVKVNVQDAQSLSAKGYQCRLFVIGGDGLLAPATQESGGQPLQKGKPGTSFNVAVEGPLPPAGTTAVSKPVGPAAAVPAAAGGATPAWGGFGAAPPAPGSAVPAAAQRGSAKSALPGTTQKQ